ncbi:MAG: branched-chain amino acid ABC transporter permease [Anaerolineae bacterium]
MRATLRQRLEGLSFLDIILWVFRLAIIGVVVLGTTGTIRDNPYTTEQWIDLLISGLTQGSLYALIALGYTLVYGVLLMINFAHGEFFMSGVFTATVFVAIPLDEAGLWNRYPIPCLFIVTVAAMATSVGVAVLTERVAYRPLRRAPRLVPLITAIGASFFWQYFFRGLYGSGITAFPTVDALTGQLSIRGIQIGKTDLVVMVASVVLLVGLYIFVMRTKTGKAMRSVSEDKDVAALMGIDVDRVVVITFAVGAALAGAAGILYALLYRQVGFLMGFYPGLKAFTAAVLGGIGSVPGAALGGMALGLFESVAPNLFLEGLGIPGANQLKDVTAFTMLVLVLLFRPQGIIGEPLAQEKA